MAKDVTSTDQAPVRRPVDFFDAMRTDMERVLDRFERGWPAFGGIGFGTRPVHAPGVAVHLDVREEAGQIVIEADLPGVDEKDVTVTLANGLLSIKGEKRTEREEKKDDYHIAERSFGRFERTLRLPDGIDESAVSAKFDKGVLKIVAPKRPEAVKSERRIEIKKA